nr:exosome complex component CSL4 [Ipomoea batatas]GME18473.1 exosome complex component CSL4 [Ipomoea batatas]
MKLNDAAFDLSNGQVKTECGEDLGETLLNISRAWEQADTSTSTALMKMVPQLAGSLTGYQKSVSTWKALIICWKEVSIHGTVWSG